MTFRTTPWIQTYTGKQFWPFEPRPGDFDIEDIAHALSNLCRFAGHVESFYSVAQHSWLVSVLLPKDSPYRLEALMHDAAEAYIIDLPRPIKQAMPQYTDMEHKIEAALAEQFKLEWPWPKEVKHADNQALRIEQINLMKDPPVPWTTQGIGVPHMDLKALEPRLAEDLFMADWNWLTEKRAA
jgi:uncharacterized protein